MLSRQKLYCYHKAYAQQDFSYNKWLPYNEAVALVTYESDQTLLKEADRYIAKKK